MTAPTTQLTACLILATLAARPTAAQEAGPRPVELVHRPDTAPLDDAKLVVTATYPATNALHDDAQYLSDLQARFSERGVAFVVVVPTDAAEALVAKSPRFAVAAGHIQGAPARFQFGRRFGGGAMASLPDCDCLRDAIDAALDAGDDLPVGSGSPFDPAALSSLESNVADGGQFADLAKSCLQRFPHSGRAHGCAVLEAWWCRGDTADAARLVDEGIRALANDAGPMTRFVDLVLRGDRNDPSIARKLAVAMAPVAAGASEGPLTQLVYLRALLRAGQDRIAGRVAARLPKHIGDDPTDQLIFAETLMEGATPMAFRDRAEQAVERAERSGGPRQWVFAARHKILKRCGDDDAAEKLMVEYRKNGTNSGLNNDAWYLMVRPATLGRFDTLALAQCEEMLRVEGAGIDYNSKDTASMAHFLNGKVDAAVEMQTAVVEAGGTGSTYTARLRRYQETQAALAKRAAAEKDGR